MNDHDHDWPEITCPTCNGSGEITWNPSRNNDPACVQDAECPACRGTGVDPAALDFYDYATGRVA